MSVSNKFDRMADIMCSLVPSITQEERVRILRAWHTEYGGEEFGYVSKTSSADRELRRRMQGRTAPEVEQAAVADYLAGHPVDQVATRHGIHRATLYRALKR